MGETDRRKRGAGTVPRSASAAAPPPPKPVADYLSRLSPENRSTLERLRRAIRAAAPEAVEVISYQMPGFRQNGMLVWYAAFSDHLSFFTGGTDMVRRRFAKEVESFQAGKGTLQFTPDHPLPDDLVRRIVRARLAENAERGSKKR